MWPAEYCANWGLEASRIREVITRVSGPGKSTGETLELTPGTQQVLEKAIEEAQHLGNHNIGTEHILLGLVNHGEGIAMDVLRKMGITADQIRRQTKRVLQESNTQTNSKPETQRESGKKTKDKSRTPPR